MAYGDSGLHWRSSCPSCGTGTIVLDDIGSTWYHADGSATKPCWQRYFDVQNAADAAYTAWLHYLIAEGGDGTG